MIDREVVKELLDIFESYSFDCECKRCKEKRKRVHEIRKEFDSFHSIKCGNCNIVPHEICITCKDCKFNPILKKELK